MSRGLKVETDKALPLIYKETKLDCGYRLDIVVEDCIILEIKSVDSIAPIHQAQLITYLKLANMSLGFLINFNVVSFKSGIKRMVNNF
jgi:GxxExxY protein